MATLVTTVKGGEIEIEEKFASLTDCEKVVVILYGSHVPSLARSYADLFGPEFTLNVIGRGAPQNLETWGEVTW